MLCISAAYAVMRCLSLCVSVCLSGTFVDHVKTNKRIFKNFSPSGSPTILVFPYQTLWHYPDGDRLKRASNARGMKKNDDCRPISRFISEMVKDTAIVTVESEKETAPKLSNSTSLNDLEWPLIQIWRSHYYSTLNNSKTVQDGAIFVVANQYKLVYDLSNGAIFNDLEQPLTRFSSHAILWRWIYHKRLKIRP